MTANLFDQHATVWDDNPQRALLARTVAERMLEQLGLDQSDRVLDYGAGTGLVSVILAQTADRVIAADSSPGMLKTLGDKLTAMGIENVTPMLWSAGQDPGVLPEVNVVTGSMVLHHVEDVAQAVRTFFELLPSGGKAAFADLDAEDGGFHGNAMHAFHNGFDREELGELCRRTGFTDVTFHDVMAVEKPGPNGELRRYPVFLLTASKP
ncbi:class I SAM-dependent methyltransferase [Fundidesulfovibrio butyratiphilus]